MSTFNGLHREMFHNGHLDLLKRPLNIQQVLQGSFLCLQCRRPKSSLLISITKLGLLRVFGLYVACKQTQTDEENGYTRRSLSIPSFWGWIFSNGSAAKESDEGEGEGEGEGEEDNEDKEVNKGDEGQELRPLAVGWSHQEIMEAMICLGKHDQIM